MTVIRASVGTTWGFKTERAILHVKKVDDMDRGDFAQLFCVSVPEARCLYLSHLKVEARKDRGRGEGTKLMEALLAWARKRKWATSIYLYACPPGVVKGKVSRPAIRRLIRFYKKFGFVIVKHWPEEGAFMRLQLKEGDGT